MTDRGDRARRATGGRALPAEHNVVPARPELGGGAATPSFGLPADAGSGIQGRPGALVIGGRSFDWGTRTFVMGILNITPDSFSGDGLLGELPRAGDGTGTPRDREGVAGDALALARRMAAEGADLIDVGGESTRPGHRVVDEAEELDRVVPVVRAVRAALPEMPISVDTTKPRVAEAALAAGANLVNDIWGVAEDDALAHVAAEHDVPLVVMHNRAAARYTSLLPEILGDLARALDRAMAAGCAWDRLLVDPGFGFGKTPEHNLALLRDLAMLTTLGRPVVLGTSRKSTLGKVLDLPPGERVEATVATTALAVQAGVDVVRVHDVAPNVRAARMADAIVRGGWRDERDPTAESAG